MSVSRETLGFDLHVSRETHERLLLFVRVLLHWNGRINLISKGDCGVIWERHVADSLQLLRLMPAVDHAIDIGSGGGFPGLVLAIASHTPFTLIESDARKCAFLREAARITSAPVTVLHGRAETAQLAPAPLVTARALAPLTTLLDLCVPLLAPGGVLLFPKGATAETEITQACLTWTMRIERHISLTSTGGTILRISEVARAR